MTHRAFLVDDEPLALARLERVLAASGRVEVVGRATDPRAALAQITAALAAVDALDVVLLDISMPELDGFELARLLPPSLPIVFTTAHDEHALRAFEVNAIDYLMKPVRDHELARALAKLDRLRARTAVAAAADPARLASRLGDKIQLIELARVTHFIAEDKLTYAVTAERSHVVDHTIGELEQRYAALGFVRIHRATLVRLAAIAELHATVDGTRVRIADSKQELVVARDRVRTLKDRLGLP